MAMNDLKAVRAWESECLEKSGFYIHVVEGQQDVASNFNAHTHGLMESMGHPDLQILAPLPTESIGGIFHGIIDKIRKGWKVAAGDIDASVLTNGYKVTYCWATESGRRVIRVILPDVKGNLDPKTMEMPFALQYADLYPSIMPDSKLN
jgi:hypothetical protein